MLASQDRRARGASFLAIGTRDDTDWGEYPDVDLRFNPTRYEPGGGPGTRYTHKDGTPYPG